MSEPIELAQVGAPSRLQFAARLSDALEELGEPFPFERYQEKPHCFQAAYEEWFRLRWPNKDRDGIGWQDFVAFCREEFIGEPRQ